MLFPLAILGQGRKSTELKLRRNSRYNFGIVSLQSHEKHTLWPFVRTVSSRTVQMRGHNVCFQWERRKHLRPLISKSVKLAVSSLLTDALICGIGADNICPVLVGETWWFTTYDTLLVHTFSAGNLLEVAYLTLGTTGSILGRFHASRTFHWNMMSINKLSPSPIKFDCTLSFLFFLGYLRDKYMLWFKLSMRSVQLYFLPRIIGKRSLILLIYIFSVRNVWKNIFWVLMIKS